MVNVSRRQFLVGAAAVSAMPGDVPRWNERNYGPALTDAQHAIWDEFYELDRIYDFLSELADERRDEDDAMLDDYEVARDDAKRMRDAALARAQRS